MCRWRGSAIRPRASCIHRACCQAPSLLAESAASETMQPHREHCIRGVVTLCQRGGDIVSERW